MTTSPSPSGAYASLDDLLRTRFLGSQLNLSVTKPSQSLLSGPVQTRFKGRGMEFEEVRVYQPGDDIRSIDWRVTARTQVTHTKLFQEEREKPVLIVVDQRSHMFFGSQQCFKSVYAAHLAASIGWAAINQNDRIGALIFGDTEQSDIRPKRSKHAQLAFLQHLVDFNRLLKSPLPGAQAIGLIDMIADTLRVARPGSKIFIISDFHDLRPECEKELYQISRHNDLNLLYIYDQLEVQWPAAASLSVSNGNQRLRITGSDQNFRQRYQDQFLQRQQLLKRMANTSAITIAECQTQTSPEQLLLGLYGKSKRSSRRSATSNSGTTATHP